jgi:hypothetical protein
LSSVTPSGVTAVAVCANTAATPARSFGASTSCAVAESGCRAGSSRHEAATEANVGTADGCPSEVFWLTQVPTAVNPRASPSARSDPAWLSWSVVVGPRGERCSVQAVPSQ